MQDPESEHVLPYSHLTTRAYEYVRIAGGSVTEDALVAFVFGASSKTGLWHPLLRQMLAGQTDLVQQADGNWAIPSARLADEPGLLAEFVAIDVETTGLRPLQQRIIEIALIRYRNGSEADRLETLIDPERRIPKYIVTLTGIDNEAISTAPKFAEYAQRVNEFIGEDVLVGHNVAFDVGFLNAEFQRAGLPALINHRVDTLRLAMRLRPSLRRPSLDRLATALGIPPRKIHRAGIDAELTARAALILAREARDAGIDSLDRLKSAASPGPVEPTARRSRERPALDRSLLYSVPKQTGVYVMRDVTGRVIYVGKAKNLRERVSSYFSQPLGYTRKMDGLLESLAAIDTELTGSELAALLLESQLIRRYEPRFNTVMRSSEQYPFIRVDIGNPWPRISMSKQWKEDGSRYFGPFRSAKAVRTTIEMLNDHLPLRTCPRSFRNAKSYGSPCLRLDLRKCAGPCVGRADRDQYMSHVRKALAFLDGNDETLYELIWTELESAAEATDFERARRLRNDLQTLRSIVAAQRTLAESAERHTLLLVQRAPAPRSIEVFVVVRGHCWARLYAQSDDDTRKLADRLGLVFDRLQTSHLPLVDQTTLDESNILNRWISRNMGHPAILPLDFFEPLDLDGLAHWAVTLPESALDWVPPAPTVDSAPEEDVVLHVTFASGADAGDSSAPTVEESLVTIVPSAESGGDPAW